MAKKNWKDSILICVSFAHGKWWQEGRAKKREKREISGVYGSIECKSNKQAIEKGEREQKTFYLRNFSYFMNKLNYMIAFQEANE